MVLTLGLIYPWMGSSLWRYRWRNTWYGDRHFEIAGNWRAFAGTVLPAPISSTLLAIVATVVMDRRDQRSGAGRAADRPRADRLGALRRLRR